MDCLLKNIVKGTVKGPHGRGRPIRVWTNDLEERLGMSFVEVQMLDRQISLPTKQESFIELATSD